MSQIITDGLVGYWHYKEGVQGNTWNNIAPDTKGRYNGQIVGATLQNNGMYFDGVDDVVTVREFDIVSEHTTIDILFRPETPPSTNAYVFGLSQMDKLALATSTRRLTYRNNATGILITNDNTFNWGETFLYTFRQGGVNGGTVQQYKDSLDVSRSTLVNSSSNISFFRVRGDLNLYFGMVYDTGGWWHTWRYKGTILAIRVYNRTLSEEEIYQNYTVGNEVGLPNEDPTSPTTPPQINITSVSSFKLSNNQGMNSSLVSFKFDQDVDQYRLSTLGVSHDTGNIIVDEVGVIQKEVEVIQAIYYSDLYQEGENRINIYGKNSAGWTPYGG